MKFNERGLSPVVASVLMILLVFVLASIVFSWARGFALEQTEENSFSSAQLCEAVDFSIAVVGENGDSYSFEAVNRGNVDIDSLKFKVYPSGDSNIIASDVGLVTGMAINGDVVLSGYIEKVEVLPVLKGKSSKIVCDKNPVYLEGASF